MKNRAARVQIGLGCSYSRHITEGEARDRGGADVYVGLSGL